MKRNGNGNGIFVAVVRKDNLPFNCSSLTQFNFEQACNFEEVRTRSVEDTCIRQQHQHHRWLASNKADHQACVDC